MEGMEGGEKREREQKDKGYIRVVSSQPCIVSLVLQADSLPS